MAFRSHVEQKDFSIYRRLRTVKIDDVPRNYFAGLVWICTQGAQQSRDLVRATESQFITGWRGRRNQFNYTVNARLQERAASGASHCEPLFGGTRT